MAWNRPLAWVWPYKNKTKQNNLPWTVCWPVLGYWWHSETRVFWPRLKLGGMPGRLPEVTVGLKEVTSHPLSPHEGNESPGSPPGHGVNSELLLDPGRPRKARQPRGRRPCTSPSSSTAFPPRPRRAYSWWSWRGWGRPALPPCPTSSSRSPRTVPSRRVSAAYLASVRPTATLSVGFMI